MRGARCERLSSWQEEEDKGEARWAGLVGLRPRRQVVFLFFFLFKLSVNLFAQLFKIARAFLKFPN